MDLYYLDVRNVYYLEVWNLYYPLGRNLYYPFTETGIRTTHGVGICTTNFQRPEFVLPIGLEFVLPFF